MSMEHDNESDMLGKEDKDRKYGKIYRWRCLEKENEEKKVWEGKILWERSVTETPS